MSKTELKLKVGGGGRATNKVEEYLQNRSSTTTTNAGFGPHAFGGKTNTRMFITL